MKLKARIRFFRKEKSGMGMQYEPFPGYRPLLKIGDDLTSCLITPIDTSIVIFSFNTTYDIYIELLFPEVYGDKIDKSLPVELYEGLRLIGRGHYI